MRFVVYDDESLEPITVLNLPFTDKDIDRRMLERGNIWRVAVPEPVTFSTCSPDAPTCDSLRTVDLEFEQFVRNSHRHGAQRSWFCFTRATELAMLLDPAWLPGQRRAIDYLQQQNDRLTRLLMESFGWR